ncbi:hypothetical protein G7046_g7991 [Stylonectria norvegica]|nr:hypothetical protein G7046_g7991 [Stylonectria norvegica]
MDSSSPPVRAQDEDIVMEDAPVVTPTTIKNQRHLLGIPINELVSAQVRWESYQKIAIVSHLARGQHNLTSCKNENEDELLKRLNFIKYTTNKKWYKCVWAKLESSMVYHLKRLEKNGHVELTTRKPHRAVWKPYTKSWGLEGWNGDESVPVGDKGAVLTDLTAETYSSAASSSGWSKTWESSSSGGEEFVGQQSGHWPPQPVNQAQTQHHQQPRQQPQPQQYTQRHEQQQQEQPHFQQQPHPPQQSYTQHQQGFGLQQQLHPQHPSLQQQQQEETARRLQEEKHQLQQELQRVREQAAQQQQQQVQQQQQEAERQRQEEEARRLQEQQRQRDLQRQKQDAENRRLEDEKVQLQQQLDAMKEQHVAETRKLEEEKQTRLEKQRKEAQQAEQAEQARAEERRRLQDEQAAEDRRLEVERLQVAKQQQEVQREAERQREEDIQRRLQAQQKREQEEQQRLLQDQRKLEQEEQQHLESQRQEDLRLELEKLQEAAKQQELQREAERQREENEQRLLQAQQKRDQEEQQRRLQAQREQEEQHRFESQRQENLRLETEKRQLEQQLREAKAQVARPQTQQPQNRHVTKVPLQGPPVHSPRTTANLNQDLLAGYQARDEHKIPQRELHGPASPQRLRTQPPVFSPRSHPQPPILSPRPRPQPSYNAQHQLRQDPQPHLPVQDLARNPRPLNPTHPHAQPLEDPIPRSLASTITPEDSLSNLAYHSHPTKPLVPSSPSLAERKALYVEISTLTMLIRVPEKYHANRSLIPDPRAVLTRKLKALPGYDAYAAMVRMVCEM